MNVNNKEPLTPLLRTELEAVCGRLGSFPDAPAIVNVLYREMAGLVNDPERHYDLVLVRRLLGMAYICLGLKDEDEAAASPAGFPTDFFRACLTESGDLHLVVGNDYLPEALRLAEDLRRLVRGEVMRIHASRFGYHEAMLGQMRGFLRSAIVKTSIPSAA